MRGFLVVEGHGDVEAVHNLISRIWKDLALPHLPWARPLRWRGLHECERLSRAAEVIRRKPDASAMLVIRDEDDRCPKEIVHVEADALRRLNLPFPAATVLMHREFEVLFLPCVRLMAGRSIVDASGVKRPGLVAGSVFDGDPENVRGVKEWLSERFPPNRSYRPSTDQLPLTRMVDLAELRRAGACRASIRWSGHSDSSRRT
ncbi:MAG: DUF4276 family protein [Deltaproteobacteria bacterium]|nr:DUF4276 family protein [Deltaproteobacteria bacterium]